jgi:hypothetical protein
METHNESEGFRGNLGRDCGSIQEIAFSYKRPSLRLLGLYLRPYIHDWGLCIDCALRSNDCAMRSTLLR